ncbi:BQ2448_2801 [Microbotryum intermedium]|uniref:BQ2448_2801 protein n=1 Tax=Microbotryum intermedium TaxID=269621 RepID=A0A238FGT7_9BASI|nr:BQ2448_2801 [Microbotryum intermedium]
MATRAIPASFWRGGTSRGLLFRASTLAAFPPAIREQIIYTAMGSPDPGGRQISGLGGGVSSLSKACILGLPGEGLEEQNVMSRLPGPAWADDGDRKGLGQWDVVYRFAQVGVREAVLDWCVACPATCGNMLSAVAVSSISSFIIPYSTLFTRARSLPRPEPGEPLLFPLSILSAANGLVMRARVPLDPYTLQVWDPEPGKGAKIAGVPEEAAAIECEMPIESTQDGADGSGLVTGRVKDSVSIDGKEITVSIVSSGLPNIFLPISELPKLDPSISPSLLSAAAHELTSHPTLPTLLERIRTTFAKTYSIALSLASPKITLIGSIPSSNYQTSSNATITPSDADLLVRAISSGDFHATIPGTTLGALNIALGHKGTTVNSLVGEERAREDGVVEVKAAHAAGVAEAKVRFEKGRPSSVVMVRTAREIMRGDVSVPERVFAALE